jgi:heme/copper-type cytochrome/quinol oxidase subunit 2
MVILKNYRNEVVVTSGKVGMFEGECSRYCDGHAGMKLLIHVEP